MPMLYRKLLFLVVFCSLTILFFSGCKKEEEFIQVEVTTPEPSNLPAATLYEVCYGEHQRNMMDVFLPARRNTSTPVVVLIHGGSWSSGNKSDMHILANLFAQTYGVAAVCINYRLLPENALPAQMEDIHAVLAQVATHQPEWHISANSFFLMGMSAGAHLALLYSYGYDTQQVVKGVVSMCGPTNFDLPEMFAQYSYWNALISSLVGTSYEENPDAWRQASPCFHVKATSCPTIMAHCENDSVVPYSQALMLYDRLSAFGVETQFFSYPTGGHSFEGVNVLEILSACEEMILSK